MVLQKFALRSSTAKPKTRIHALLGESTVLAFEAKIVLQTFSLASSLHLGWT